MKQTLFLLAAVLLGTVSTNAQDGFKCGLPLKRDALIQKDPRVLQTEEALEQFTKAYIDQLNATRDESEPTFIIPVVFHIVHNYGVENIGDEQVYDAMRQMNEDFRKLNADTLFTVSNFLGIAADCKIEFRLARKDPNGNCTNGIDRIVSMETYVGDDNCKLNQWPPDQYLNFWVVNTMDDGTAAYAYYPSAADDYPQIDGIVTRHNYVGVLGTSSASKAHTLSHEVGHYLNLRHTWGNGNIGEDCGNDNVNDTPQTMGWTSCNLNGSVCSPGVIENVQNFMEYAYCSTMFTAGQRNRMHAALNSGVANRNNLWSTENLVATGTDNLDYVVCAPSPTINPVTPKLVCAGESVTFNAASYTAPAEGWSWNMPGATPAVSTDSTVTVVYDTPGTFDVSLTATNPSGSNTATAEDYVFVLPTTGLIPASGFSESFETMTFPNDTWTDVSLPGFNWQRVTNAGYSGTASMKVTTQDVATGRVASFVTPTFDLTGNNNPALKFRMAHALRASSNTDQLRVFVSENCGKTWTMRYSKSGASIATANNTNASYTPSASHWREETVNLTNYANSPNVRIRFEYTQKGGNNLYIDDINFDVFTGTGAATPNDLVALSIFPNPANDELAASFNLKEGADTRVRLISADGRTTELAAQKYLSAGHQLLRFDTRGLPVGYYTLWITAGQEEHKRSVIIKR